MKESFEQFLIAKGYKEFTQKGLPSTVYDYSNRINKICEWEQVDWRELAERIDIILPKYEEGGEKSYLGQKSHNAVRCALRCFKCFVKE